MAKRFRNIEFLTESGKGQRRRFPSVYADRLVKIKFAKYTEEEAEQTGKPVKPKAKPSKKAKKK
jgi:hypothetical protein